MGDKQWLAPLSGVAFLILLIAGFAIAGEPPDVKDDSAQEIVDFYTDNKDQTYGAGVAAVLAGFFLMVFAGYLRKLFSVAEGERGFLSAVLFAGSVITAIWLAIDGTIAIAIAETGDDIDPIAAQTLQALWENDFLVVSLGLLTFLVSTGISIVRHGILPKWLGWVLIVGGLCAPTPAFPGAGLALLILVVTAAIVLTRRERAGTA